MAEAPERDDRTEEPTQRRLDEAIQRGDVARSVELTTFLALGAATLALAVASGFAARNLSLDLRGYLMNAHLVAIEPPALIALGGRGLLAAVAAIAVPVGLVLAATLAGAALQHRPMWTLEPLAPKWSRLSPGSGLKRLFGREALVQFLKGLVKIGVVGAVLAAVLWGERDRIETFARLEPGALLPATLSLVLKLMLGVVTIYGAVAAADVVYQRLSWMRRQRMSKRELKEEVKLAEGSPEVKARLRQLRAVHLRRRMMQAVPQATVVLANPTHFAVALRYEGGMGAPVCTAKGVDALALRIRAVAEEHGVPVIENPPLARALHATVEVDQEIPVEHYRAVAEVVGYVLRLRRRPA